MPFLIMEKKMQIADGKVALFHYDLKETSGEFVESSKEGLQSVRDRVKVMTAAENLPSHYKALAARFEK